MLWEPVFAYASVLLDRFRQEVERRVSSEGCQEGMLSLPLQGYEGAPAQPQQLPARLQGALADSESASGGHGCWTGRKSSSQAVPAGGRGAASLLSEEVSGQPGTALKFLTKTVLQERGHS